MIVSKVLSLPRNQKRLIVLSLDLLIVPFALWCSFSLRLGVFFSPEDLSFVPAAARSEVLYLFLIAPVAAIPIFIKFGLYRAIIRYVGFVAMWSIVKAVSLYTAVFAVLIVLIGMPGVPRSVIIINWLLLVLLIGGTRALGRWWLTGSFSLVLHGKTKSKVIIYGAGHAGVQIASALAGGSEFQPIAFIDDNPALQGNYIEGYRVYPFSKLSSLKKTLKSKKC